MRVPLPAKNTQSGFTLVELVIVLMVIGLLIAGVLRGKEMITIAKLNATIRQYQAYVGSTASFRDSHSGLPGDYFHAVTRIPGCNAAASCVSGNGDSRVGTETQVWAGGQHPIVTENSQYWKHLSMMKLISGIDPTANQPVWGISHPITPINGGFTVVTTQWGGESSVQTGALVLRLHMCLTCANVEQAGQNGSPLTPQEAYYIDAKIDDGRPRFGDIQSKAYGNGDSVAMCEGGTNPGASTYNQYQTNVDRPFCMLSFLITK